MFITHRHTSPIRVIEEPNLQDLLVDPATHLIMESDGVSLEALIDVLTLARRRLQDPREASDCRKASSAIGMEQGGRVQSYCD